MKKIAITLSAATLLLGGLVGCGVDQQGTTGQGGVNQRGFGYHATEQQDTGFTGQRAGEGPITDMFTRDDRRGARGFGRDNRQPATGLAGDRVGTRGTGQGTGLFGGNRGTGQGTGLFGGTTGAGTGTGMTGQGAGTGFGAAGRGGMTGHGTGAGFGAAGGAGVTGHGATGFGATGRGGMTGHGTGAGFGAAGRGGMTGHGTGAGLGAAGRHGLAGTTGGLGAGMGTTGAGRGQAFGTADQRGAGIVGNRPGYVDDRGILRERAGNRAGIGGLGRHQATPGTGIGGLGRHQATPGTGIYGTPDTTGTTGMHGLGQQGANGRAGDRVVPGTGMSEFAYPDGYDATTVRDYSTRLADVQNVNDSRVIVHGNRVLVGVDADRQNAQRVEQDVRQRLRGMTGDREVIVVTERDRYDQIRTADDRLRAGEPFEEVGATINDMFHDFGRAIQRPFERSR